MGDKKKDENVEETVEDLITLSTLNHQTILQTLQTRYKNELIYTYIGSILVAINPYKIFNIYGKDVVKKYEGCPIGQQPPHLFAIGSVCYEKMLRDWENQVVLISGESGSGKTESCKLIMQYVALVNRNNDNLITEQILEGNPLLESFGNAKTIRNDNSSRFGKYIELFFQSGSICGARTAEYLLERSRIVKQPDDERNYHVFYEMLSAMTAEEKKEYGLQDASQYFYLNQGNSCTIAGRNDAENFHALTEAMDVLGFSKTEKKTIQSILASVLHLGNIYFCKTTQTDYDMMQLGSDAEIQWISYLLGLSPDWLKSSLTTKVMEARDERLVTPFTIAQAQDARDAIAKALYCRLFTWLVERINQIVYRSPREKVTSMALLDIFGFEDISLNSFEQLCINYANETLQSFFNECIFLMEQKEYKKERINWTQIDFPNNQELICLISSKPSGIFHILDDECNFPKASDKSFLEKCHYEHSMNRNYEKPRMSSMKFIIYHYAGKVTYNAKSYLEKNKDTLQSDVVELLCESKNSIICQMFEEMRGRLLPKTLSKNTGRYVTMKPKTPTVSAQFNESLASLVYTMKQCNPYFVRCIKPNNTKSPMLFQSDTVMEQLKYTGILQTINIRKWGYPVRIRFPVFIDRYKCLLTKQKIRNSDLPSEICRKILLTQHPDDESKYQIGTTKVFLKEAFEDHLEKASLSVQHEAILSIQQTVRAFLVRRKFQKTIRAATNIQSAIRSWKVRNQLRVLKNGFIQAQATYRMHMQRKVYQQMLQEISLKNDIEDQHKVNENNQENMSNEASLIANMEIPGELAHVLSKDQSAIPIHADHHITTVAGTVVPIDMKYELPNDINAHPFTKYVGVYFKNQSWAVMSVPIRDTFLSLNNEISKKHALSIFKLILRFMADSKMADRRKKIIADYIIQKCLQDEQLRDEIYCQLVNQTWKNPVTSNSERGWFLLAFCLCSIIPSNTLKKYLLKYVSDLGYNGYKEYCQHKLLQSFNIRPSLCRTYPPCLLEWKAALRKSNMALTAKFPDDDIQVGHVDSWTTGEKFAAHLLDQRNMYDNHSGWTVVLEEGPHYYELMGNDYVLDLISEIEIVTGFPVCKSFTFVYTDRTAEPVGRKASTNKPHDPERDRTMTFTGNFPEILPLEASIQTNAKRSKKDIALSLSNPLNQRRAEDFLPDLTSESPLNNRYHNYKLRAASPLSSVDAATTNGSVIQAPSNLNRDSQLNKRYMSSSPVNINETDIANSKLNARYTERTSLIKAQPLHLLQESVSARSDDRTSNWAKWVDNVFENVLNDNVDDLSDARSLESRIKGGGNGLTQNPQTTIPLSPLLAPTQAIQSNFFPPLTVTTPTLNAPVTMPISTGILSPIDPMQLAAAQMAAQQLAAQQQQQTQQQALAQALYNQMQQQAQQQNLVQAALQQQQQQQQQQTALYQAALQQQQITQMQTQLQQNPTLFLNSGNLLNSPPLIEETSATTLNTSVKAPPKVFPKPVGKRYKEHTNDEVVTRNSNLFNQPSYVLKSSQRSQQTSITNGTAESTEDDEEDNKEAASLSSSGKVTAYVTRVSGISNKVKRVGSSVSSKSVQVERQTSQDVTINGHVVSPTEPLLASSSSQSNRFSFPEPQKQQQQPPPPPPPPPPPAQIPDEEKIPGTFRNLKGTIRHVRVGKVVWPPPTQEFKKLTVEVGKLEIDENLANEFNRKIGEGGKKRRIPSGKELKDEGNQTTLKKTETSKSHSLTNTSHLATIKMLERKLSCKDAQTKSDSSESEEEVKAPVTARLNMIPKAPPIPSSSPLTTESQTSEVMDTTVLENTKTRLYPQVKELFLTYQDIPCTLRLRKEVFSPKQKLDYAAILNLVFCQVVRDVFNSGLIRINKEQRVKMRSLLESHGVNQRNFLTVTLREQLKRIIVDTAKEWPTYFCRLYPVACPSSYSTVKYLGVSHSGVYMIAREQTFIDEQLSVVESFKFEDIVEVVLRSNNIVQLTLRHKGVLLYTKWDKELKKMIDEYRHENERGSKVAFALKDYIVDRPTLLSFRSKDVIKLMDAGDPLDEGWLYGSLNGNVGFFPEECVRIMPQHEVLTASREPQVLMNGHTDNRSDSSSMSAVAEGNFPMLEYATHHFRESLNRMQMLKTGMSPSEWTEKDQAEMVKWTKSPIHASLLMLSNKELNQLALESFTELMTFMGDLPQNKRDTQCALRILRICHKYPELRDEVYCQLCKQTTNNTSSKAKSLIRGWRFFSLYAAYNDCSSTLRPYLLKYLTIAATDTSDPNNICTVADICLKNLRKTLRYGGRKNVPLEEEITNLSEGRMTKTQLFSFFGMTNPKHSVEVRSSTLVKDIIEEIGQRLGIIDTVELEEYTLFLVINSGKPNVRYHRISRQEYFFDITADLQKKPTPYDVVFQRAVWNFPIRPTTNEIYINLMFYQSIPNFLDGYLILSKNGLSSKDPGFINELAMMASLLHRSQDERTMPVMKGLKTLLPQTVLDAKILKPQQWLNKIHEETNKISTLSPFQSKAHFLNILSKWKLFGSTFFKLKSIPPNIGECYLAINRHGIQILTKDDRETIVSYEFSEILSTRRYNSENNKSYLDMKLGNLMAQKISRVETDECSAISNLIGQYMHVINLHKKRQGPLHPSVPS